MHQVSVSIDKTMDYSFVAPFDPAEEYPELARLFGAAFSLDASNRIYGLVRDTFLRHGLDAAHAGTAAWNPFSEFIRPGDHVLVKPNLVLHFHGGREGAAREDITAVVTQAAVIRPVLDYALLALGGTGQLVVADAPQANADFDAVVEKNGLRALIDAYAARGMGIGLIDLRKYCYPSGSFATSVRKELTGDPCGYRLVDLGARSFLAGEAHLDRLYGSDYDRSFIEAQHADEHHRYLLSGSVLDADVIISMPKLKTHRKAGVTINCKNMVGANGDKNYLAHYRVGDASAGGDEFPPDVDAWQRIGYAWDRFARDHILVRDTVASRRLYRALSLPFRALEKLYRFTTGRPLLMGFGDWHGNDTVWRMCLDLNQIVLYADKDGRMHDTRQRRYFSVVDGIVAGELDGPLSPTPKHVGYVACGFDPFEVDHVAMWQMGFDPWKLQVARGAMEHPLLHYEPETLDVCTVQNGIPVDWKSVNLQFRAQQNWQGFIERVDASERGDTGIC